MRYPLVLDLAADGIPVVVTCRALGFSKQAFYAWKRSPVSDRDWADAHLINTAVDIHHDDPAFGYRFIAAVEAIRALMVAKRTARSERIQTINQARALVMISGFMVSSWAC